MNKEELIKNIIELLNKADENQIKRLLCFIQAYLKAGES